MLCLTVESSFFSALQTSQVHPNSIYAQPKQEPILLQHSTQTQVVLEKKEFITSVPGLPGKRILPENNE